MNIFFELTGIIILATLVSIVMQLLKQPLIVGYIFTGILGGSYFLDIIHAEEQMELFAKIGIIILLFIVGLNLNPKVIKEEGKISLLAGLGQIVFTAVIGFFLVLLLGIQLIPALYISLALTFSSTIIIMKLLSDRADLNKVYGKISVGILLVQDLVAILTLIVVSSFASMGSTNIVEASLVIVLKGIALIGCMYVVSVYLLPKIGHFLATSQELLFLFSLTWGLGLASVFHRFGFSIETGALAAGISLAALPFADGIASRMKPLRDFFVVLFFILLGSQMRLDNISEIVLPAIILSLFVLIGNPIIVIVLMNLLGYKRKTAFQTGVALAQISEFSLILATLAFNIGHIPQEALSLITLVGVITIASSAYLILHSDTIYPHISHYLRFLELRKSKQQSEHTDTSYEIILFGFDRVGHDFIEAFSKLNKKYLVVDFNPALIPHIEELGIPFKFGDAEDIEFLHELPLAKAHMIVSTIPDVKTSLLLVKRIRVVNKHAIVILLSHDIHEAKELYAHGATYVIMPHYLGARHASDIIARLSFDMKEFEKEKEKHMHYLEKREIHTR